MSREGCSMKTNAWRSFFRLIWMTAAALALALMLMTREAKAPVEPEVSALQPTQAPAQDASGGGERVGEGCQVMQTMAFSRCGHSVSRRVDAPEALWEADFTAAQAYYDLWQIESFSSSQISMSRELPLFCPMHTVLGVNEAGEAVLSRNVYGDGMAVTKPCGVALDRFSEADQEALLLGIGFDSAEEAEAWLDAHL